MEVEGTLRNACLLFTEKDIIIETFVIDDNSSSKSILCHSWQLVVDEGILDHLDWP
jgi:hypothetical protein